MKMNAPPSPLISRAEAVAMIARQLNELREDKSAWHYGVVELRELLDAIYGPFDPAVDPPLMSERVVG